MHVVRLLQWSAVSAVVAAGVTACAADSTAPAASSRVERAEPRQPHARDDGNDSKEGQVSFTLDPRQGYVLPFGDHRISLPANAICDPGSTTYGPAEWDRPCAPATRSIHLTIVYRTVHGEAEVRLLPDLRFAPASDPARWVVMSLKQNRRLDAGRVYTIYWWDGGTWVDESQGDSTLTSWADHSSNTVSRRLKHFSGYSVTAGRASSPSDDETAGY